MFIQLLNEVHLLGSLIQGFRKVDPDCWEFAHESFLRGQMHLLPLIVRRKKKTDDNTDKKVDNEDEEEDGEVLMEEVGRLRREQKALEEELQGMNKRLQVTEQRPHQMISFLVKVAEDPELLPRLILTKKEQQKQRQQLAQDMKKRRLLDYSSHSLAPLPQSSFEWWSPNIKDNSDDICRNHIDQMEECNNGQIGLGNQVVLLPEFGGPETSAVAYPFSLLGHVFF